jgi:hypothetical protein
MRIAFLMHHAYGLGATIDDRRRAMGRAALASSAAYDPARVAARHVRFLRALLEDRARPGSRARAVLRAGSALTLGVFLSAADGGRAAARKAGSRRGPRR